MTSTPSLTTSVLGLPSIPGPGPRSIKLNLGPSSQNSDPAVASPLARHVINSSLSIPPPTEERVLATRPPVARPTPESQREILRLAEFIISYHTDGLVTELATYPAAVVEAVAFSPSGLPKSLKRPLSQVISPMPLPRAVPFHIVAAMEAAERHKRRRTDVNNVGVDLRRMFRAASV